MTAIEILTFVQEHWDLVRQVAKQRKQSVAALLSQVAPTRVEEICGDGTVLLVIEAPSGFFRDKLRTPGSREVVEWALAQVVERPCRVRISAPVESCSAPHHFDRVTLQRLMFVRWMVEHGLLNEGEGTTQP